jgi:glucose-6-phosphate dehydrogenase assembly protein OpcA
VEEAVTETRTSGSSGRMNVGAIEHELARLRMNDDGTIGLRASVLNLIVVSSEEESDSVTALISGLSGRFPCRAIVLISDPDADGDDVGVKLAAFCSVRGGSSQVCAEQVTIHAYGSPARHLESLAGPLLVPDLPVFLFYPGPFDPYSREFRSMAYLADRVIVDSGRAPEPAVFLPRFAHLVEEPGMPDLIDLQWTALSPWRALLAELFSPPERTGKLEKIEHVEVLHEPDGGEARALLLIGWLASVLGWETEAVVRAGEEREIAFSTPSGRLDVVMAPSSSDAPLRRVELWAGEMRFEVHRCQDAAEFRAVVKRGDEVLAGRTARLGHAGTEEILEEEMQHPGQDESFRAALRAVSEMLER